MVNREMYGQIGGWSTKMSLPSRDIFSLLDPLHNWTGYYLMLSGELRSNMLQPLFDQFLPWPKPTSMCLFEKTSKNWRVVQGGPQAARSRYNPI